MVDKSDPDQWRPGGEGAGGDSIAGQLASRIEKAPSSPGDAMDWAAIAARYEREATALGDRPGAAELLFEAGRVFEERLGEAEAALGLYRRAFSASRRFLPNLRALHRLAEAGGDQALLAEALSAEAELAEDPAARAGFLEQRAAVLQTTEGAPAPAPAPPVPARPPPPPTPLEAAQADADSAAAASDDPGLVDAYRRCAEAAGDARVAAHYLLAASEVATEGLRDSGGAGILALAAFARCPEDPLVRSAARLHAARTGDLLSLAEVLRADAREAQGPGAAVALTELARVEERLGHGDQAADSLEKAWTVAPDEPRVLSELARLREARREWAAAADALEALAAAHMARGGPGHRLEAVAAKLRRIEIEEAQLANPEAAMRACRDVLVLDPAQRTALAVLGRLCAGAGDWEGVLAAFRAEAEAARDPRERAQRTFKAAQVLDERLANPAEAALAYRSALAQDPELLAARSALERLLEREGRIEELCHLIEAEITPDATPAEEVDTLFRLARLEEEHQTDPAAGARRYRRILELEPGNPAALRALRLSLERSGSGSDLAETLAEEARRANPRRRLALLQRRAEVLEELAGDAGRALEAWEEIRALQPDHIPALRALGRLHAAAGRWDAVAAQFHAQADATHDPAHAAEMLLRAAEIEERRLSRPDTAVALYREVLTLQPSHPLALQCLTRIYRTRDEHESLTEVLLALASSRESPPERAAILAELGDICAERLRDPRRAVEAYEEALRADPGCLPALRALERLYLELDRDDELAALRRSALDPAQDADRTERLLRLAWQEAHRAHDGPAALAAAGALASALPDSPATAILQLRLGAAQVREGARAALGASAPAATPSPPPVSPPAPDEPLPQVAEAAPPAPAAPPPDAAEPPPGATPAPEGEHVRLAQLCEARIESATDPGSRAAWAVQAGEAWERAGDQERALAAYQAALTAAPAHLPALRAARNVFAQRRDWGAVRATLQAEGETLQDGGEAATAWHEAGAIAEQWFGDIEGAVQDYRAALEQDPSDPVALTRVEALLGATGQAQLAEVHAARARAERDAHRAADAWLAAARAAQAGQDGRRAALGHLDEALDRRPDHAAALELRARLRALAGQPSLALDDLERCLALGGEPATQVPLHLTASALCDEKLLDPGGALRHAEAALALAPESTEALSRLARLHRTAGRLPAAAAVLRRLTAIPGLPRETLLAEGFALAAIEADLGEVERGLAACRRVLDADPGHPEVLRLQVELERRRGDPQELVAALAAAATSARDETLREDAHLEVARLHAGTPETRAQALEHLRAALELDPERDDVRASLAEVAEEGQPSEAMEQHRRLLVRDPARIASWTALYRLLVRSRSHDGAFVAATVLRWLGAAPPGPGAEQLLLEGDRQILTAPPPLGADFELLRAPGDRGPLSDLVAVVGDILGAVLTDPRETRGAPVRGDHPFRRVLSELARALGAGEFELYAAPMGRLTVEPGLPAAVRVGADLAHRSTVREQRFMLGCAAARLRTRSALVEAFPADFAHAVGAAVRLVVPHYAAIGQPSEPLSRRLEKAVSRRTRRTLEEPARAVAHLRPTPDLAAWRAAAAATADRAGLALCGDVATALDLLLRDATGRKPAPADRVAALGAHPEAQALLTFAASEAHFTLRQKLRVAIA
jgi:tetratricopeptide (TPR) repeat protein